MNSRTHSTTVAAWHADVFAYLSQSANIPEWAPGFAREVRVDGDDVLVTNDAGERRVRVRLNEEFGIVDFLAVRADGLPSRRRYGSSPPAPTRPRCCSPSFASRVNTTRISPSAPRSSRASSPSCNECLRLRPDETVKAAWILRPRSACAGTSAG